MTSETGGAAESGEAEETAGGADAPPESGGATGADRRRGPFRAGDRVQLTDAKRRMHTITLVEGKSFHTHRGYFRHDDLIGQDEGTVVTTSGGTEYLALRPLLDDYVLSMPRGATVVYPKDAGQIIHFGDVFPGARVIEAGVGSGALSMALLRAVGDAGRLHSFERREEFARIAVGNARDFFGHHHPAWQVTVGDLAESLPDAEPDGSVDRAVLDMLAPWECLDAVASALTPGGVLVCYIATATQLSRLVESARADGRFTEPAAWESMVRGWHLDGLSVRPEHRMIGHTGFLVTARRMADGVVPPRRNRRPQATDATTEDKQAWTDGKEFTEAELGERPVSNKKIRRALRETGEGFGLES